MLGTSPAILACLRCFITVLNIILGVSSLSSQLRRQMMFKLAGLRSPHLSILPRVLPLDGLLPRLHLGRLLHHHHLPPQHLRQHLLLLLPRLLLPRQEQLAQSSVLHGNHNNNECPH